MLTSVTLGDTVKKGTCVSSPGRAQQSSGTTTCLMGKVRACGQGRDALREAFLYPAGTATLVSCFWLPYKWFSAPNASPKPSSVASVACTCVVSWVIWTRDSLMPQPSHLTNQGWEGLWTGLARKLVSEGQRCRQGISW